MKTSKIFNNFYVFAFICIVFTVLFSGCFEKETQKLSVQRSDDDTELIEPDEGNEGLTGIKLGEMDLEEYIHSAKYINDNFVLKDNFSLVVGNTNESSASGIYSFVNGNQVNASGDYSHAEGWYSTSSNTLSYTWNGNTTPEFINPLEMIFSVTNGKVLKVIGNLQMYPNPMTLNGFLGNSDMWNGVSIHFNNWEDGPGYIWYHNNKWDAEDWDPPADYVNIGDYPLRKEWMDGDIIFEIIDLEAGELDNNKTIEWTTTLYQLSYNYGSHGDGTFNINPNNGASGFYIGETNILELVYNYLYDKGLHLTDDASGIFLDDDHFITTWGIGSLHNFSIIVPSLEITTSDGVSFVEGTPTIDGVSIATVNDISQSASTKVSKSGDIMTGTLVINNSLANGFDCISSGDYSHAEGWQANASNNVSYVWAGNTNLVATNVEFTISNNDRIIFSNYGYPQGDITLNTLFGDISSWCGNNGVGISFEKWTVENGAPEYIWCEANIWKEENWEHSKGYDIGDYPLEKEWLTGYIEFDVWEDSQTGEPRTVIYSNTLYNETKYGSHGDGTFNINPEGGFDGVYVGNKKLSEYIAEQVQEAVTQALSNN